MATIKVTDASFAADVLSSDKPVVVDFWADWCGPCKMIGPALEELSDEMGEKLTIAKLDIMENTGIASQFGVQSIPLELAGQLPAAAAEIVAGDQELIMLCQSKDF